MEFDAEKVEHTMSDPQTSFTRRLRVLGFFALAAACVLSARLAYLQVIKHSDFDRMARRQQLIPQETQARRGMIKDRNGELWAVNLDLYNVFAHPRRIKDRRTTAIKLANALGRSYNDVLSRISTDRTFVWLARQIPFERSHLVETLKLKGVEAYHEQRRLYPDHSMAAHVLGFAGIDNQGLEGLEKSYDAHLGGKKGYQVAERDGLGKPVLRTSRERAVDGLNIVTTLDRTLQHIAQVELEKAFNKFRCQSASVIVMDPKTGEILAMANYPDYDPNRYKEFPQERWRNRCVDHFIEPGSTFKLVTAAAALEEGLASEEDRIFCENGKFVTKHGRIISDHEKKGWLTFREVFGYSSNIGFTKLGMQMGADRLYKYAKRFGFGDPTGIDLPSEVAGVVRPPKQWSGLSLSSIPYGYEVSATPLQVLCAYAAVANGGVMMKPYLVRRLETPDGRTVKNFEPQKTKRVCSPKTAERLTALLKWAVKEGTGTAVDLPNYDIAGKTGTAHKIINKRYSRNNYISSFVGFVPADDPRFAIYVSLDDPRGLYWGGYTAGPVFKEIARRACSYALVAPKDGETALVEAARSVPSFVGLTQDQCRRLAARADLRLRFEGKGARAVAQSHPSGFKLASDNRSFRVDVTLGEPELVEGRGAMPNLTGKTKRQALAMVSPMGLRVSFTGRGVVKNQYPPAGRIVESGVECRLNCETPISRNSLPGEGSGS
jgi:stage V sporulation protein D (sporulation-specific penicillin-binding protein)